MSSSPDAKHTQQGGPIARLQAHFDLPSPPILRPLPLRSLLWATRLQLLPLDFAQWPAARRALRQKYRASRRNALRAPDGSLPPELDEEGGVRRDVDLGRNNPLGLDNDNPWQTHFASLSTLTQIEADVSRTFPDEPLFRVPAVQSGLARLLFVYCCASGPGAASGYRQGMHELAGLCWLVRHRDAVGGSRAGMPAGLENELGEDTVEDDAYALFDAVMRRAGKWYEWREESDRATAPTPTSQTPIMAACAQVRDILRAHDPTLAAHLDALGIEPQLYVLRWIRLLFTRELPLEDSLVMWDTLFGADAKLDLVPYVCVAMLLRIRAPLLLSDYAGCFSHLLRFPSACEAAREPAAQEESTKGLAPALLVQQACALRDEPTGAAARLAQENEAILGLAVKVSPALIASNAPSSSRPKRQQTPRTIATGRPSGQRSGLASAGLGPPGSSSPDIAGEPQSSYLPEGITDLARGIYSRADAFGVNRALVNAMGNVQRTVGAYAAAGFAGPGRSATANDGFPPALERVPRASASLNGVARPSVAPQDPARELAALKASNAAMGAAVAACVDVFERQWVTMGTPSGGAAPQAEEQLTGAQVGVLMSLTALKHTRDVLLGIAPEFDSATVHVPQLREAIPQALPSPPASRIVPAQVQPRSPEAVQPASAPAHGGARQAQPPYQPRVARGPAAADPLAQASPGSFSHARPSPPPRTQLSGSAPAAVDSSSAPSAKTSPVTSTTHNARAFARSPDSTMPPQLPASSASAHVAELPSAPPIRPSNLQPSSQRSVSPSDPLSPPLRSATFDSRRLSRPGLSCNTFSEAPVERSAPAPQPPRQATAPAQPPPTRVSVVHSPLDPLSQFVSPRHEQHGAAPTTSLRSGSLPGSDPLGAS